MIGKLGILIAILFLVFLFFIVISLGAGVFSKKEKVEALSLYWMFLLIIWLVFFLIVYVFNDAVIAWCKALIS